MAEQTAIAWTHHTWSPWIGCSEVSPGCDHCYARELDKRYQYGMPPEARTSFAPHWGPRPRFRTKDWTKPLAWNRAAQKAGERHLVFPSMCDPFDNAVDLLWRHDLWKLILSTPHLDWLLLTKRIGNVARMWPGMMENPLPNVWLGASVVNQEEADRDLPKLLATPAAARFVSYEPALDAVDFRRWLYTRCPCGKAAPCDLHIDPARPALDWIILGGESSQGGAKARPFDLAWARSTIAQCKAAGVPCFVKQLGSMPLWPDAHPTMPTVRYHLGLKNRAGADPTEWPDDLRVRDFPTGHPAGGEQKVARAERESAT